MPNRIVREGILSSLRVDRIADSPETEVFYRRLLSAVDDYGRYAADSTLLRAALYPRRLDRVTDRGIAGYLAACESAGLVRLYSIAGEKYLEVLRFRQQLRAKRSKFPAPQDAQTNGERMSPATQVRITDLGDTQRPLDNGTSLAEPMRPEAEARGESPEAQAESEDFRTHPDRDFCVVDDDLCGECGKPRVLYSDGSIEPCGCGAPIPDAWTVGLPGISEAA